LIAAVVIAVMVFALMQRPAAVPEGPQALPVVGADLHSFVVDPADAERLFIGSHQGVSVSTDGGDSWEVIESLNGADAMGWAISDDAIYVGGHPGLSVSTDGGGTFEMRNDGLPNTDIHALGAAGDVLYAATPGAGLIVSSDGGATWEVRNEEVGGAFMGRILVDPQDPDRIVAPDMQAGAVESGDGGRTWEALGGVQGAAWVSWNPSDTDDLIVAGMGQAAMSTDGGKTWNALEVPQGAALVEFSPDNPSVLYAAVHDDPNAHIWISRDGAKSWAEL
jgi:photosystem II stability/assembly factor-like uncharacterized protein